jgi:OmpA-OmpF porin, OOP family
MKSPHILMLASTALLTIIAGQPQAHGTDTARPLLLAQSAAPNDGNEPAKLSDQKKKKDNKDAKAKQDGKPAKDKTKQKAHEPAAMGGQKQPTQAKTPAPAPDKKKSAQQPVNMPAAKTEAKPEKKPQSKPATAQQQPLSAPAKKPQTGDAKQAKPEPTKQTTAPAPSGKPAGNAAQKQPDKGAKPAQQTIATPPPPNKPRSTSEFIRRKGDKPGEELKDVRSQRHETRQGNRVVIQEGNRTIERENNRAIIRHSESDRFAVGARHVDVEHRGDQTITIVLRPDGIRIISTTDRQGRLLRRVRRDPRGRDIVIIDSGAGRGGLFVNVPPPHIRDRGRYFLDAGHADRRRIYEVFTAPPIARLDRHYTLDQVRYSYPLREYMPRVDLDISFATGSWQLTPSQIGRLAEIAAALKQAIDRNPREVFLVEGHTDAVGSWEDNLSLSDRRAESVAVVLTEEFHVPSENLVTQGYGEQHLKEPTEGASRANRRVAVRRITPLIAQR